MTNDAGTSERISNELRAGGKAAITSRCGSSRYEVRIAGHRSLSAERTNAMSDACSAVSAMSEAAMLTSGLLLLVLDPLMPALQASDLRPLVTPQHDGHLLAAVSVEGVEVVLLAEDRGVVVEDQRGEVLDRDDLIVATHALDEMLQIQPEVAAAILGVQAVVQVEAVDVGDDASH
ncbi:hypothetical protein [Kutzneria kofuensis]